MFIILGNPKLPPARRQAQKNLDEIIRKTTAQTRSIGVEEGFISTDVAEKYQHVAKLATNLSGLPAMGGNAVSVLTEYDEMIASIAADIDGAKKYVQLEYYIIALDETTQPIFDALRRATKRGVDVPRSFTSAVESAFAKDDPEIGFRDYLAAAEEVYRTRGEQQERPVLKPGAGIPAAVRKALERESVPFRPGDGMTLKWGTIPGKDFFWFDRETDEVVLNERYRTALLSGRKASSADLPVLRALIFFLLAPTLERERDSVAGSGRLRALQSALIAAAELERSK